MRKARIFTTDTILGVQGLELSQDFVHLIKTQTFNRANYHKHVPGDLIPILSRFALDITDFSNIWLIDPTTQQKFITEALRHNDVVSLMDLSLHSATPTPKLITETDRITIEERVKAARQRAATNERFAVQQERSEVSFRSIAEYKNTKYPVSYMYFQAGHWRPLNEHSFRARWIKQKDHDYEELIASIPYNLLVAQEFPINPLIRCWFLHKKDNSLDKIGWSDDSFALDRFHRIIEAQVDQIYPSVLLQSPAQVQNLTQKILEITEPHVVTEKTIERIEKIVSTQQPTLSNIAMMAKQLKTLKDEVILQANETVKLAIENWEKAFKEAEIEMPGRWQFIPASSLKIRVAKPGDPNIPPPLPSSERTAYSRKLNSRGQEYVRGPYKARTQPARPAQRASSTNKKLKVRRNLTPQMRLILKDYIDQGHTPDVVKRLLLNKNGIDFSLSKIKRFERYYRGYTTRA